MQGFSWSYIIAVVVIIALAVVAIVAPDQLDPLRAILVSVGGGLGLITVGAVRGQDPPPPPKSGSPPTNAGFVKLDMLLGFLMVVFATAGASLYFSGAGKGSAYSLAACGLLCHATLLWNARGARFARNLALVWAFVGFGLAGASACSPQATQAAVGVAIRGVSILTDGAFGATKCMVDVCTQPNAPDGCVGKCWEAAGVQVAHDAAGLVPDLVAGLALGAVKDARQEGAIVGALSPAPPDGCAFRYYYTAPEPGGSAVPVMRVTVCPQE